MTLKVETTITTGDGRTFGLGAEIPDAGHLKKLLAVLNRSIFIGCETLLAVGPYEAEESRRLEGWGAAEVLDNAFTKEGK